MLSIQLLFKNHQTKKQLKKKKEEERKEIPQT